MSTVNIPNHIKLVNQFDNKEAIYLEKGLLRVKVFNIRRNLKSIWAEIEEIPTKGLGIGMFETRNDFSSPDIKKLRFEIGGGYLTTFSENQWSAGYGGWSIFFDKRIINGVVNLAERLNDSEDRDLNYKKITNWMMKNSAFEEGERVFP